MENSSLASSHWHVWTYTYIHSGDKHDFQPHPMIGYNVTVRVVWPIKQLFSWTHRGASHFLQVDTKPIYCKHWDRLSSNWSIHTIEQEKSSMTTLLTCSRKFLSIQCNWKHTGCRTELGSHVAWRSCEAVDKIQHHLPMWRCLFSHGETEKLNTGPSWPNKTYTHDHGRWHVCLFVNDLSAQWWYYWQTSAAVK